MAKKKSRAAKAFNDKRSQSSASLPRITPPKAKRKIRLLYHGDSPKVNTGFGVVAREVLSRLNATGKYEIHCVGINDKGDPNRFPECQDMIHYPLPNYHEDPYGVMKLPEVMHGIKPDLIFTLNDIWVLEGSEKNGTKGWFIRALRRFAPNVPWVLYFPVDSRPWTMDWANLAFSADKTIVYSRYAEDVLKEIHPSFKPEYIHHGVSLNRFNVISDEDRVKVRESMGVGPEDFLLGFISRNQPRKNPAAIIEIFKMANEGYRKCTSCDAVRNLDDPKCEYCGESNNVSVEHPAPLEGHGKCYLHFNFNDSMGLKIHKVISDNNAANGIVYNPDHSIPYGLPEAEYNAIFNSLDCHLLTTMSEGFGLTVLEGMACGVPTMATRTTAVTELLEQGGGIPIIPRLHHVFDDAANTRKHIIDPERTLNALKELYDDWKQRGDSRWGPETQKRVDKGIAFAHEFTWDRAAAAFDIAFQEAIDARVKIVDTFTEEPGHKMLFQKAGNGGDILNTLPAVQRFKDAWPNSEITYAIPSNLMPLFEDRVPFVDTFIPMDRMSDKNPEEKQVKVNVIGFSGPEERYEQGAYPYMDRSRAESYCLHVNVDPTEVTLKGLWDFKDNELELGADLLNSQVGDIGPDDFVVGLVPLTDCRRKAWGEGAENWKKLTAYLEKMKMKSFMLDENMPLAVNLAALKKCNLVVTVDGDILDFLHALDIPTIALISPFWRVRAKGWDGVKLVCKDDLAKAGMREVLGPNGLPRPDVPSPFMDQIGAGEVFSPILTFMKMWKQMKRKANEESKEEQPQEA